MCASCVELVTFDQLRQRYPQLEQHRIAPSGGAFCRAERLKGGGAAGTYAMPRPMVPTGEKHFFGFYLTQRRLLLAEDDRLCGEILCELLEDETGRPVSITANGRAALEMFESANGEYDAIIMDVQMPVMNGYEATEQIRSLDDPSLAGITILAMTANAFDEDRKKALACGMDGFLSKPIVIEELISTLQNSLG